MIKTETLHNKTEKPCTERSRSELVPQLRFQEFEGEWKRDSLSKIAKVNPRTRELPEEFIYIDLESVTKGILVKEEKIFVDEAPSRAQRVLDKGDILYQTVRPYQKNNYFFNKEGDYVASTGYAQIKTKYNSKYLFQFLHNEKFVNIVNRWSTGTSYPAISPSELVKIKIAFPTLPEQQKIAGFLTAVDTKIRQLTQKKELLEQYKKGVMRQLFSQELRFKPVLSEVEGQDDGSDASTALSTSYPDWEEKRLGEVVERVTRKNKENNQNVLTISAQQGLINQEEYFSKSVSAKDVTGYYLLERDDFAYNKSYSKGYPLGAIKRLTKYDKGVVSTLYIIFKSKNKDSVSFLEQLFEGGVLNKELQKIAQEGARNHGLLNLSVVEFFKDIKIEIPSKEEQQKIASFLSALDTKIEKVAEQIEKTQEFKKGLLQQMFV